MASAKNRSLKKRSLVSKPLHESGDLESSSGRSSTSSTRFTASGSIDLGSSGQLSEDEEQQHGAKNFWATVPYLLIHFIIEALAVDVKDATVRALSCTCKKWNRLIKLHQKHYVRTKLVLELRATEVRFLFVCRSSFSFMLLIRLLI